MRYAFLLMCLGLGVSCTGTLPAPSPEYLRCPGGTDTPWTPADSSLFGATKANPYNCNNDRTICATLGANFSCNTEQGCCKEADLGRCTSPVNCTEPNLAICNLNVNMCEQCSATNETLGNMQCAAWAAVTQANYRNRTVCVSGTCMECHASPDCKDAAKPVCDMVDHTCKGCTKNADCQGSQICKLDPILLAAGEPTTNLGQCVKAADAAFVDNTAVACSNTGAGGMPYCQISQAISAGKSYINVAGNGTMLANAYQQVSVNAGRQVFILGPGRDAALQAVINGVTVSGSAQLTLLGISVTNNAMSQPAIQCNGSATLYVQNVLISKDTAIPAGGIYASSCSKLSVERTKIHGANGYGISIAGGSGHRIVNNAIINNGNGTESSGLKLSGVNGGLFAFNTIAHNIQGVTCDSAIPITDSIVIENLSTQFSGCQQTRVDTMNAVLDQAYRMGGTDPQLTSAPQNDACCINKAVADPTIQDDYLFIKRPRGSGYDYGAYEAR